MMMMKRQMKEVKKRKWKQGHSKCVFVSFLVPTLANNREGVGTALKRLTHTQCRLCFVFPPLAHWKPFHKRVGFLQLLEDFGAVRMLSRLRIKRKSRATAIGRRGCFILRCHTREMNGAEQLFFVLLVVVRPIITPQSCDYPALVFDYARQHFTSCRFPSASVRETRSAIMILEGFPIMQEACGRSS